MVYGTVCSDRNNSMRRLRSRAEAAEEQAYLLKNIAAVTVAYTAIRNFNPSFGA